MIARFIGVDFTIASPVDISRLEKLTGAASGLIRPIPSKMVEECGFEQLRMFLHKYGLYTMPTTELIEYLAGIIAGKRAIEIGAGMGVIGRALGIPVTDNKMQAWPSVKAYYDLMRQPTIRYPVDIIELDAHEASRHDLGEPIRRGQPENRPQGGGVLHDRQPHDAHAGPGDEASRRHRAARLPLHPRRQGELRDIPLEAVDIFSL